MKFTKNNGMIISHHNKDKKAKRIIRMKKAKENFWGYFFIIPILVFFGLFMVYPLLESIRLSLYEISFSSGYEWMGLKNYITIFKNDIFIKSIINTFLFVLCVVPSVIIVALFLAAQIVNKNPKLQAFLKGSFYLPAVVSIVSVSLVWRNLYNPIYGHLNHLLSLLGMDSVNWLGNTKTVIFALSVVVFTINLGQPLILYIAAIGGIPPAYYEASEIDGANGRQKFWHITLPLLTPTTLYIFVTTTIASFQVFAIISLMTSGGPNYASSTVMYLIYKEAFTFGNFGSAAAMGVILAVCVGLVASFQFKFFSRSFEF